MKGTTATSAAALDKRSLIVRCAGTLGWAMAKVDEDTPVGSLPAFVHDPRSAWLCHVDGAAMLWDLPGVLYRPKPLSIPDWSDLDALRTDWAAIGDDFWTAVIQFVQQLPDDQRAELRRVLADVLIGADPDQPTLPFGPDAE